MIVSIILIIKAYKTIIENGEVDIDENSLDYNAQIKTII